MRLIRYIGRSFFFILADTGRGARLFVAILQAFPAVLRRRNEIVRQMFVIGNGSLPLVLVTSVFTGAVATVQAKYQFRDYVPIRFLGTVVAKSVVIELGPVLTALVVGARVGASIAAELGTMKVTEQIDALATMGVSPVKYLMVPRIIAGLIMLPVLTIFSDVVGIAGGYFVGVEVLDANPTVYIKRTFDYLDMEDIVGGLVKAAAFGVLIALISSYKGFVAEGGAEGVGRATTGAVVLSSMAVLISNYFITSLITG
jgi:phospholipid/cholesterol/gamma-HCH transport system permease protein